MTTPLLTTQSSPLPPDEYLSTLGEVFACFDMRTQDSGNVSFGVRIGAERYFVKSAGSPNDSRPYLSHPERVRLLRNAVRVFESCPHPALASLRHVIQHSPWGPLLVYDWVDGELLHKRGDGIGRFRTLPAEETCRALDAILDAHRALAEASWVAVDFYDGCMIYDFETRRMRLVDLDHYHRGPFTNEMGRMFGSTRFMAPEEFQLGARIDARTTVFTLGRTISVLLSDGSLERPPFRGPAVLFEVMLRACRASDAPAYDSVSEMHHAWSAARPS
jgi:serine/threonine protein kinase, bacterial